MSIDYWQDYEHDLDNASVDYVVDPTFLLKRIIESIVLSPTLQKDS